MLRRKKGKVVKLSRAPKLSRSKPAVLTRTPKVRNCLITMKDFPDRYFASVHMYSHTPYYHTKKKAMALHENLKKTYYWEFIMTMKIKDTVRILIRE